MVSLSFPASAQVDMGDLLLSILMFRTIGVAGTSLEKTVTILIDENVIAVMDGDYPIIIYRKRYWYLRKLGKNEAYGVPLERKPERGESLPSLRDHNVEPVIFRGV